MCRIPMTTKNSHRGRRRESFHGRGGVSFRGRSYYRFQGNRSSTDVYRQFTNNSMPPFVRNNNTADDV